MWNLNCWHKRHILICLAGNKVCVKKEYFCSFFKNIFVLKQLSCVSPLERKLKSKLAKCEIWNHDSFTQVFVFQILVSKHESEVIPFLWCSHKYFRYCTSIDRINHGLTLFHLLRSLARRKPISTFCSIKMCPAIYLSQKRHSAHLLQFLNNQTITQNLKCQPKHVYETTNKSIQYLITFLCPPL